MKKIFTLMLLCLLLCAMSVTALAATVSFTAGMFDNFDEGEENWYRTSGMLSGTVASIEAEIGSTIELPKCGFTLDSSLGYEFFAWCFNGEYYYDPEDDDPEIAKLKVTGDMVLKAYWVRTGGTTYKGYYDPGIGNGQKRLLPIEADNPHQVFGPESFGFTGPNNEAFQGWKLVSGVCEPWSLPSGGDSIGWLFARAIAENDDLYQRDDWIVAKSDFVLEAQWDGNGGGSTEPAEPQYNVNVIDSENGTISVAKSKAKANEKVSITIAPASGYGLDELKVTHADDAAQQVTVNDDYSFVMPACDVNVEATFVPRNQVIFYANGGECTVARAAVNASNKLDNLPKATRKDYAFVGWFTQAQDGTAITKDTVFDAAETPVYAQWVNAQHTTKPEENAFHADLDMEDSNILDLLINDEDTKDKENIIVYLTVEETEEDKVPSEDKTAIVNKAGADQIAAYLDIELFKQIGNHDPVKIPNPGDKVRIKLKLSDELIPENAVKDSFYIIYYHGGAAKKIDASFNTVTKELIFYANEFSTYSLVYKTQSAENVNASLPKTGDSSLRIDFLFMMLATALCGLRLMAKKRMN